MDEQTTIRASVAISPSAAVVYLEGVDCTLCAKQINPSLWVASPCLNSRRHALETVRDWRRMSITSPEDYRVVEVEIVDHGDTNTNITAARIAALSNNADETHNQ